VACHASLTERDHAFVCLNTFDCVKSTIAVPFYQLIVVD
jgi:hypothetical protein